jgi:hypothetical protein
MHARAQVERIRKRVLHERAKREDAFTQKWKEIESAGCSEESEKWTEWLKTKDGLRTLEVESRRLKKQMEAPPQDQSEELQARLKTQEGAGQKGCKWKWYEHPVEGCLAFENKETNQLILDYQATWEQYKVECALECAPGLGLGLQPPCATARHRLASHF